MSPGPRSVRGGVFALEEARLEGARPAPGPFAPALAGRGPHLGTSHARGALEHLVRRLDPPCVWLPAYLCDALLTPGVRERARFFPVDDRLDPSPDAWLMQVRPGDLTVLVAYFGWPPPPRVVHALKDRGAWTVVDASQALLTEGLEDGADYLIASPRKFVGVPDGGLLVPIGGDPELLGIPASPLPGWPGLSDALEACRLRGDFDLRGADGPERDWYERFTIAEAAAPDGPRAMSAESRTRLAHGVDWPAVAEARRANWLTLARGLGGRLLFERLPDGVVPLGCCVLFDTPAQREQARAALHAEAIYAPWHWNLDSAVPLTFEAAHRLSRRLLTLPCDQRYAPADMEEIVAVLAQFLPERLA